MKILNRVLQSGHVACLAWSTQDVVAEGSFGGSCWHLNDETADMVDDVKALRASSCFPLGR